MLLRPADVIHDLHHPAADRVGDGDEVGGAAVDALPAITGSLVIHVSQTVALEETHKIQLQYAFRDIQLLQVVHSGKAGRAGGGYAAVDPQGGDAVPVIPPGGVRGEAVAGEGEVVSRQIPFAPDVQHAAAVDAPGKAAFDLSGGDLLRRAAGGHAVLPKVVAVAVHKMVPPRGGDGPRVAVALGLLVADDAGPGPDPDLPAGGGQGDGAAVVVGRRVREVVHPVLSPGVGEEAAADLAFPVFDDAVREAAVGHRGMADQALVGAIGADVKVDRHVLQGIVLVLRRQLRPLFLRSLEENLPQDLVAAEDPVLQGDEAGRQGGVHQVFAAAEDTVVDDGHMGRNGHLLQARVPEAPVAHLLQAVRQIDLLQGMGVGEGGGMQQPDPLGHGVGRRRMPRAVADHFRPVLAEQGAADAPVGGVRLVHLELRQIITLIEGPLPDEADPRRDLHPLQGRVVEGPGADFSQASGKVDLLQLRFPEGPGFDDADAVRKDDLLQAGGRKGRIRDDGDARRDLHPLQRRIAVKGPAPDRRQGGGQLHGLQAAQVPEGPDADAGDALLHHQPRDLLPVFYLVPAGDPVPPGGIPEPPGFLLRVKLPVVRHGAGAADGQGAVLHLPDQIFAAGIAVHVVLAVLRRNVVEDGHVLPGQVGAKLLLPVHHIRRVAAEIELRQVFAALEGGEADVGNFGDVQPFQMLRPGEGPGPDAAPGVLREAVVFVLPGGRVAVDAVIPQQDAAVAVKTGTSFADPDLPEAVAVPEGPVPHGPQADRQGDLFQRGAAVEGVVPQRSDALLQLDPANGGAEVVPGGVQRFGIVVHLAVFRFVCREDGEGPFAVQVPEGVFAADPDLGVVHAVLRRGVAEDGRVLPGQVGAKIILPVLQVLRAAAVVQLGEVFAAREDGGYDAGNLGNVQSFQMLRPGKGPGREAVPVGILREAVIDVLFGGGVTVDIHIPVISQQDAAVAEQILVFAADLDLPEAVAAPEGPVPHMPQIVRNRDLFQSGAAVEGVVPQPVDALLQYDPANGGAAAVPGGVRRFAVVVHPAPLLSVSPGDGEGPFAVQGPEGVFAAVPGVHLLRPDRQGQPRQQGEYEQNAEQK